MVYWLNCNLKSSELKHSSVKKKLIDYTVAVYSEVGIDNRIYSIIRGKFSAYYEENNAETLI